ncbi:MAG: hypothetical protein C0599_05825 [Salinivirgaceae bacterium]|nr:MAG: hypothetical protein C0599_05825 [Salinivirgaceae bacterium]
MKKVYLPIIFMLIAYIAGAQSFEVKIMDTDTVVSNNDTILAYGMADDLDIQRHFNIENLTASQLRMDIIKENTVLPDGMASVFCLSVCYAPNTTDVEFTIEPSSAQSLDVDLWPYENSGEAIVKITLATSDGSESMDFYVKYYVNAVGIFSANTNELNAYPNPVTSTMNIYFNGSTNPDTKVDIYDAVGKLVLSQSITGSTNYQLNLSELPRGIYMLKLVDNSNVIQTKKIIKE